MTLFEYLTVAISIVLSMSIVRSLEAAGDVIDPKRRDRIHVMWFLAKAFQPALTWWSIWGLHAETAWTYLAFLLCLSGPIILFFQITTLATREPDDVPDWGAHFMNVRRRFFGAEIAGAATAPALIASFGDLETAQYLVQGAVLETALAIVGLSTTNRRIHLVLASIVVLRLLVITIIMYEPLGADGYF